MPYAILAINHSFTGRPCMLFDSAGDSLYDSCPCRRLRQFVHSLCPHAVIFNCMWTMMWSSKIHPLSPPIVSI